MKCSDDRCLEIISQRLRSQTDEIANGVILEVDEAAELLEKDDVSEMKDEKENEEKRANRGLQFGFDAQSIIVLEPFSQRRAAPRYLL